MGGGGVTRPLIYMAAGGDGVAATILGGGGWRGNRAWLRAARVAANGLGNVSGRWGGGGAQGGPEYNDGGVWRLESTGTEAGEPTAGAGKGHQLASCGRGFGLRVCAFGLVYLPIGRQKIHGMA